MIEKTTNSWYLQDSETVLATFQTSTTAGLSSETVQARFQQFGPNRLPEIVPRSRLAIFIDQFKSIPVALLTMAAVISVLTGGIADALVIMGVVLINSVIGYVTESQSDQIIRSLSHQISPTVWVIREGNSLEIPAQDIVPGDILLLRPGTYIAADARVIEVNNLSVDESVLTGESLPVTKQSVALTQPDVPLGDRLNMLYMGTLVTGGQGLAVVVATATLTEIGKIQTMVGNTARPETPMEQQLNQVGGQLVLLSSAVCGIIFAIGLLRSYPLMEMLKTAIALAVAAVPEGLPAVATTTLALGIRDMLHHKVLIRRLEAVETLGSVQSLCLDKTGTLTANKMSVAQIQANDTLLQLKDGKFAELANPDNHQHLFTLLQAVVLCNESTANGHPTDQVFTGSPTENALLELVISAGMDVPQIRQQYPVISIQHRSLDRNFMQTVHQSPEAEKTWVAVKGNPMEVLALCHEYLVAGTVQPLIAEQRAAIATANDRMAGEALRVLGVAYGNQPELPLGTQDGLVWLGLVGLADPIRHGVQALVATFHRAGIDTVMVTGDQSPTAYAIGKELNLSQGEPLKILDSTDLTNLAPDAIATLCDRVHIFSRISPANKLQVVQALQRSGKIVAMTGDGINDTPALKAAEVGIAMGHAGTDAAREVADVVLEDDNLETMAIAISKGRTIYSNIRQAVRFLLSTNLSEILVMFVGTSLGIGQPLNALQLLWLNLVTDIFPGLALALAPPEPDVLSYPPRDPKEPIMRAADFRRITVEAVVISISALSAYGYALRQYGISPQASTIGFMSLTLAQLLHAISCRSQTLSIFSRKKLPSNPYLAIALIGSIALQLLSAVIPQLRQLLRIAPLSLLDSAVIAVSAVLPLLVNEATKGLRLKPGYLTKR